MFPNPPPTDTPVPQRCGWRGWVCLVIGLVLVGGVRCGLGQSVHSAYDLLGRSINPLQSTNRIATVLVFIAVDCPISNRYAPELQRLSKRFGPVGVSFWFVYPDKDSSPSAIRKHAKEFGLGDQLVWDPHHVLVASAHAQTTPEVAVFTPRTTLVYHGQIDDRFVALGSERPAPTRRYLEETLRAVVEHRPIATHQTKAVGCSIPD